MASSIQNNRHGHAAATVASVAEMLAGGTEPEDIWRDRCPPLPRGFAPPRYTHFAPPPRAANGCRRYDPCHPDADRLGQPQGFEPLPVVRILRCRRRLDGGLHGPATLQPRTGDVAH